MPTFHFVRRSTSVKMLKGAQKLTELQNAIAQAKG
jgi:hypothetical protein